jgi:hypothetical protein
MATPPQVGKNVDSWCTRCKLVLAHTIETVLNGKITKVHCNTCRATISRQGTGTRQHQSTRKARMPPGAGFQVLLKGRTAADARRCAVGPLPPRSDAH